MAVTLTASNALIIQSMVNEMWGDSTAAAAQYKNPAATVSKLIQSQNLRFKPVMDDNGICVDFKVFWYDLTDAEAATGYSGTVKNPATACDVAAGATIGTKSATYNKNLFLQHSFSLRDDLCGNDATFNGLAAEQLNHYMQKMRVQLNERAITFLNANKTANVDTSPASAGMTTAAGVTTVPFSIWNNQDIITKLNIIAQANRMGGNFLILDGTNMLVAKEIAPYLGLNDNQQSFGRIYGDISARYSSDILDLSRVTTDAATFIANPGMFGFFNSTSYSPVPRVLNAARGQMAFRIKDPELMYRRTIVTASGTRTEMAPVEYDVVYQYDCDTPTDAMGKRVHLHKWEISFVGGMHLGPVANSGHTNIIKFVVS